MFRLATFIFFLCAVAAAAADGDVKVEINGQVFQRGASIVRDAAGGGVTDQELLTKVRFTARVLVERVLSENSKAFFSASNRARWFAAAADVRRIEPWKVPLLARVGMVAGSQDEAAALAEAKVSFKVWTAKAIADPKRLVQLVARKDGLEGLLAYRENAVIHRRITKKNGILTYEEALRFLKNEALIARAVHARAVEAKLGELDDKPGPGDDRGGKPAPADGLAEKKPAETAPGATPDQGANSPQQAGDGSRPPSDSAARDGAGPADELEREARTEVIEHADKATTPEGLDDSHDRLRDMVANNPQLLQGNPELAEYAAISAQIGSDFDELTRLLGGELYDPSALLLQRIYRNLPQYTYSSYWSRYLRRASVREYLRRQSRYGRIRGRHDNPQSTITQRGVTVDYTPTTRAAAEAIYNTYQTIPGGLVFEGTSPDLATVASVKYLADANAFIFNDDLVYLAPVSPQELSEIFQAIGQDDRFGVSLGRNKSFGGLSLTTTTARNLLLADNMLGALGFGSAASYGGGLVGYAFAPGFKDDHKVPGKSAITFAFRDFRFGEDDAGEIVRSQFVIGAAYIPIVIPPGRLTAGPNPVPDLQRIAREPTKPSEMGYLKHLADNIDYYGRERILRAAFAYGETATLARTLKARGLSVLVPNVPPPAPKFEPTPVTATTQAACADRAGVAYSVEQRIAACTALINASGLRGNELSRIYSNRAVAYAAKRDKRAQIDAVHAVSLDPQNPAARIDRARVFLAEGGFGPADRAIADMTEVLRRDPKNIEALLVRAEANVVRYERDPAIADATLVLSLDPSNATAYFLRGKGYALGIKPSFAVAQHDRAVADFTAALRIAPGMTEALFQRGQSLRTLKKPELAIADYDGAIQRDPRHYGALAYRGYALIESGDVDKAFSDFAAAATLEPNKYVVSNLLIEQGRILYQKGNLQQAVAHLRQAHEKADGSSLYAALWLHIVERRAGLASDLRAYIKKDQLKWWPGGAIRLFLGEAKPGTLLTGITPVHPYHTCEANLLTGIWADLGGQKADARKYLLQASRDCESKSRAREAKNELERLGQ